MSLIDIANWVVTAVALLGAYLNAKQKKEGFLLWMISNAHLAAYNATQEEYAQALLFLAYLGITIHGFYTWKKNEQKL
jgi:nicotinamide riboside transporter PnuC